MTVSAVPHGPFVCDGGPVEIEAAYGEEGMWSFHDADGHLLMLGFTLLDGKCIVDATVPVIKGDGSVEIRSVLEPGMTLWAVEAGNA